MNKLWIFGDSFSSDFDIKYSHQNHIDYMNLMDVNEMIHWPTILANKLNYKLVNLAKGGNSNYQIFFNLCENINQIEENDIILIGWALIGKFIIADNNQFSNIHPHGLYFHAPISSSSIVEINENRKNEIWVNEVRYWEKLINEFIKLKNCKIIFWSGEEDKLKNINIDVTKCETMRSETDNNVQDSHLGNLGHNTLAEIFYKELSI